MSLQKVRLELARHDDREDRRREMHLALECHAPHLAAVAGHQFVQVEVRQFALVNSFRPDAVEHDEVAIVFFIEIILSLGRKGCAVVAPVIDDVDENVGIGRGVRLQKAVAHLVERMVWIKI